MKKFVLGIIGAGNMASAIVGGIIKSGILTPDELIISDTDAEKLTHFSKLGTETTSDNKFLASNSQSILFAVKPQIAPIVFEDIASSVSAELVISIMAGLSLKKLADSLGSRNYARVMPNTPALVGEGMSAVAFNGERSQLVLDIFGSIGKVVELDESLFDAVTSLSGSGPAYVYMFIDALIKGGIQGGLDLLTAKELALQTVRGAAQMIEQSDKPIDELVQAVCSKGGTTIQAVDSFKEDHLQDVIIKGMTKCRHRSKELGNA